MFVSLCVYIVVTGDVSMIAFYGRNLCWDKRIRIFVHDCVCPVVKIANTW